MKQSLYGWLRKATPSLFTSSIPFCRSPIYLHCNFASCVYPASDHERYVDRLIKDLAAARTWAGRMKYLDLPRRVDTVYSRRRNANPACAGADRPPSPPCG